MAQYNFFNLLHRQFQWTQALPDGSVKSGTGVRNIPICIPKIQRDYAEGRNSEAIGRKRYSLLNDMLDVAYGIRKYLSFDFVYGYVVSGNKIVAGNNWQNQQAYPNVAFEPLDGQQRLTTLFLLYWIFGRDADLRDQNGHSLFFYETRDTSEEFCHWLVKQSADTIIPHWESEVERIKSQNKSNEGKWKTEKNTRGVVDPIENRLRFPLAPVPSLFTYMQSFSSFKWDWHDDPNIHSMITVIEHTVKIIKERGLKYEDGIGNKANLDNITFMLLDDLVCDGDQLFEKMNARGKALTSFEILKSSLEEEMEQQGLPKSNASLVSDWQNAMDGDWIDYCWDSSDIGANPQLKTVRSVEEKLERLLVRMVGKSFYATDVTGTPITSNSEATDYTAQFIDSISKRETINQVIDRYLEYARHERAIGSSMLSPLDFQSIYDDLQNLLFKDANNKWQDASSMLPQLNRSNKKTLMEEFVDDNLTHNTRVMVYAMFAYLRIVPAKTIVLNNIEKANFVDWMRFVRNAYNSDNKNSGLDNFQDVKTAISAIDQWLVVYKSTFRNNTPQDILRLILNHIKNTPHSQEQARLDEEAIKADLRINGTTGTLSSTWETSILDAEDNFYLWGQIIAPLSWSYNGTTYDKTIFDHYVNRINQMFTNPLGEDKPIDALIIQSMLCQQDYRHNCKNSLGSLGRLNNNRDYSWKQYLRKKDNVSGYYGPLFKDMIDRWDLPANSSLSFDDFLKKDIASNKGKFSKQDWQYYIVNISDPQTLLQIFWDIRTYGRYLYSPSNEHAFFFRSDTFRTTCRYELLTTYLSYEKRLLMNGVKTSLPAHTADIDGAHVDFTMPNGDVFRLSLGNNALYNIEQLSPVRHLIHSNIDVATVEAELRNLGVISSL